MHLEYISYINYESLKKLDEIYTIIELKNSKAYIKLKSDNLQELGWIMVDKN